LDFLINYFLVDDVHFGPFDSSNFFYLRMPHRDYLSVVLVLDMLFKLSEDHTTITDMIKLRWWGVNATGGDNLNSAAFMHTETTAGAMK
jgi:hypothetical protein